MDDHAKTHRKQLRTSLATFKTLAELALDESIEHLRAAMSAVIGKETLVDQVAEVETWLSGKHSHVFNLVVARFSYLRQFAPGLLEHLQVEMEADSGSALQEAIALLRQLNQAGNRTLPKEVPSDFLPKGIRALVCTGCRITLR